MIQTLQVLTSANMYVYRATDKNKRVRALNSKLKALPHFKVDPILKIDETVYKQAKSMGFRLNFNCL